jgi:hypothetical protein
VKGNKGGRAHVELTFSSFPLSLNNVSCFTSMVVWQRLCSSCTQWGVRVQVVRGRASDEEQMTDNNRTGGRN